METIVRRGDGLRTKHLVTGKGCFVILGLNFQRQNRKCPLGLGPQERNQLESAFKGGPSRVLTTAAGLEFKAPSEFWCLFPLTYYFLQHFFFFLMERQLRSWHAGKFFLCLNLAQEHSLLVRENISPVTQFSFFFFLKSNLFCQLLYWGHFFSWIPFPLLHPPPQPLDSKKYTHPHPSGYFLPFWLKNNNNNF